MQIIENRTTKFGQLIQLTLEDNGKHRVQIWTEDNMDWDFVEGTEEETRQLYELVEHIDDLMKT